MIEELKTIVNQFMEYWDNNTLNATDRLPDFTDFAAWLEEQAPSNQQAGKDE